MSKGEKRQYYEMLDIAEYLMRCFQKSCYRIEVAGSLRRKQRMVGDIELIAIPRFPPDLFGDIDPSGFSLIDADILRAGWEVIKDGSKYKQLIVADDVQVDLFLQPDPATWGINYLIRTGPRDFSRWLVTPSRFGGALPWGMKVSGGRLVDSISNVPYDTPEEEDVFREIHRDFIEVADREKYKSRI